MKKTFLKFVYLVFISTVCFYTFCNRIKAEDDIDCSNKLLRCTYPIEKKVDLNNHKYLVDCYFDSNGNFECKIYCKENCSAYNYYLKSLPNPELFTPSTGKYKCPDELKYRWVSNSSDDIYFKNSTNADDPTYKFDMTAKLDEYCKKQEDSTPTVTVTACGSFGNNYDKINITSTKNNITGTFSYSAKYIVNAKDYPITNIDEAMTIQNKKSDGCPINFKYYLILPNGDGTYYIELTDPSGNVGSSQFEEFTGWSSSSSAAWAEKRKYTITVENIFKIDGELTCDEALKNTLPIINDILKYMRIGAIVLFAVLSAIDYLKAIVDSDQSAIKKSNSKLIKRAIALIVLMMLPSLINLVLAIVQFANGSCGVK